MPLDAKHHELQSLRIDRSAREEGEPPRWARRYILIGIAVVALLSLGTLLYRLFAGGETEVTVAQASVESAAAPGSVLTASGYIVAHHKINVNSKVTGRVAWIGVEKGDKVKEGQVIVRLEDQEFRAQYNQARGATVSARAYLDQLEHGSRPEEIQAAEHNLDEARATLANDRITLDRTRDLARQGVLSQQALDDATARYQASQQRASSLEQTARLARIGPRTEEIARARGALLQAQGSEAYAKSLLDATVIRAPVSGTILERTAEKGELVTAQFASGAAGGPQGQVVALADLTDLQVQLDIAQADFSRLGPQQKGVMTTDAFPDRKYNVQIAEISPEADRQKATVEVKVQILNPDSYLRPDMNATVNFQADESKTAGEKSSGVVVPAAAVSERGGRKVVFVAYDGKAVMKEVRPGAERSNGVLVEGLVGGETVVTQPPAGLKDGDRIKIKGQS